MQQMARSNGGNSNIEADADGCFSVGNRACAWAAMLNVTKRDNIIFLKVILS
jgi:hypothetical protein